MCINDGSGLGFSIAKARFDEVISASSKPQPKSINLCPFQESFIVKVLVLAGKI
jgi:hypothetical protein